MAVKDLVKEFDEAIALGQPKRGRRIVGRLQRELVHIQDRACDDEEVDTVCESVADAWARWKTSTQVE